MPKYPDPEEMVGSCTQVVGHDFIKYILYNSLEFDCRFEWLSDW